MLDNQVIRWKSLPSFYSSFQRKRLYNNGIHNDVIAIVLQRLRTCHLSKRKVNICRLTCAANVNDESNHNKEGD